MKSKIFFLFPLTAAVIIMLGCGLPSVAVNLGGGGSSAPEAAVPTVSAGPVSSEPLAKQQPKEPAVPQTGSPADSPAGLTISDFNTVPPDDAAREMYVYNGGGGPGGCSPLPAEGETVNVHIPGPMIMDYCWPSTDQKVKITVISPDRSEETTWSKVEEFDVFTYLTAYYPVDLDRAVGRYTLRLEGATQKAEIPVDVLPPDLPILYTRSAGAFQNQAEITGSHHVVEGAGFGANETVRVWAYAIGNSIELIGWQELKANEDGEFLLNADLPVGQETAVGFVTTGAVTGEVHQYNLMGMMSSNLSKFHILCPGALPQRLKSGTARALRNMNLREDAGLTAKVSETLKAGDQIIVEGGPYCVDERWWWVVNDNGDYLYAAESSGANYLLEMVP